MRNLVDVLEEILAVENVPEELRPSLEDVQSSAAFAAPGNQQIFWKLAAENLQRVLGKPDCEWKHQVHAIFTSREAQPLREGLTKSGTKTRPDWKPRPPRPTQPPPSQRRVAEGHQRKQSADGPWPAKTGSPPQGGSDARAVVEADLRKLADEAAEKYLRERGDPRTPLLRDQFLDAMQKAVALSDPSCDVCAGDKVLLTGEPCEACNSTGKASQQGPAFRDHIAELERELAETLLDGKRLIKVSQYNSFEVNKSGNPMFPNEWTWSISGFDGHLYDQRHWSGDGKTLADAIDNLPEARSADELGYEDEDEDAARAKGAGDDS